MSSRQQMKIITNHQAEAPAAFQKFFTGLTTSSAFSKNQQAEHTETNIKTSQSAQDQETEGRKHHPDQQQYQMMMMLGSHPGRQINQDIPPPNEAEEEDEEEEENEVRIKLNHQFEESSDDEDERKDGDEEDSVDEGEREEARERWAMIDKEEEYISKVVEEARNPKELSWTELGNIVKGGCLAPGSIVTYTNWLNSMLSKGFPMTPRGLCSFIVSREADCLKISNRTVEYIIVAFKHFYFMDHRKFLEPVEQRMVDKALTMRKRAFPDADRATGALNKVRTEEFRKFIKEKQRKGKITKEQAQMMDDVAVVLYACALRVFQLTHLSTSNECLKKVVNTDDNKMVDLLVRVLSKGHQSRKANQATTGVGAYETKQVHPLYQQQVLEIFTRRGAKDAKIFYDFTQSARKLYSDTLSEAAIEYDWPEECRYSGTHCSRHGAAQDAYEEGGLDLVMLRTGHLSAKSAEYYALSDAQRIHNVTYRKKSTEERKAFLKTLQKDSREKAEKAIASGMPLGQFYHTKIVESVVWSTQSAATKEVKKSDDKEGSMKEMKKDQVTRVSSSSTPLSLGTDPKKKAKKANDGGFTKTTPVAQKDVNERLRVLVHRDQMKKEEERSREKTKEEEEEYINFRVRYSTPCKVFDQLKRVPEILQRIRKKEASALSRLDRYILSLVNGGGA